MRLLVMIVLIFSCLTVQAWTPKTRGYMAMKAFAGYPADLKQALKGHRDTYLQHAMDPDMPDSSGALVNEGCILLERINKELSGQPRFRVVAADLGRLMAVMAEMGDPFLGENSATALDYRAYVERKLPRFFFAYQPLSFEEIRGIDPCVHLFSIRKMGDGFRKPIEDDYQRFGNSVRFDDRSAAFGCGALVFSDTCLEMCRTTILIWDSACGEARNSKILTD